MHYCRDYDDFPSFSQTGFMETLKAQFTPGQPLSPSLSMAIEERVTGMQLQHENENLKAEIRDLNEKLETLKGLDRFLCFFYIQQAALNLCFYPNSQTWSR